MIVFVDFEASSLLPGSYPIEVAWVGETGQGESYLIRPEPRWLEVAEAWSAESEAVHGIPLATLIAEGIPAGRVAARALEALGQRKVVACSDAPGTDGAWLGALLSLLDPAPKRQIGLLDVQSLYGLACRPLADLIPLRASSLERERDGQRVLNLAQEIIARAEEAEATRPRTRHRALPDAEGLWRTWRAITEEVARHLAEEGLR